MTATLFDQETVGAVRPSDPATSHAVAGLDRTTLKARVRDLLERYPQGLTDFELASHLFADPIVAARRKGSVSKRRHDIGAVDTGRTRPSPDNNDAIVWALGGAA